MSPTPATPKRRMERSTSSRRRPRMRSTPGRPAATDRRPRHGRPSPLVRPARRRGPASAPLRIPPSTRTSAWSPTAATTPGRAANDEATPSSWRPPWFETITASAPLSTAFLASSDVRMPDRDRTAEEVAQPRMASHRGGSPTQRSRASVLDIGWPCGPRAKAFTDRAGTRPGSGRGASGGG